MSGIVSGITKVFSSVGSAVARIGSAVTGVGASMFTAGAASGAGSLASGGMTGVASSMSGTLGRVITGALGQAAVGALVGGGIGMLTGNGFGKGALMGGLAGAATGGLTGYMSAPTAATGMAPAADAGLAAANTATGVTPTGITRSAPSTLRTGQVALDAAGDANLASRLSEQSTGLAAAAGAGAGVAGAVTPPAAGGGLMSFLQSETGGSLISGLGEGALGYYESQQANERLDKQLNMQAEEYDAQRADALARETRLRDSYNVDPSVMYGPAPVDTTVRPTPAEKYSRERYRYDPAQGRMVMSAA